MKYKYAVVVGASSGIGREIVRILASQGTKVCAVARRADLLAQLKSDSPEFICTLEHDVTDFASVPAAFQEATKLVGGLDLIVYCAGVMPQVSYGEYSFDKDKQMVDVNVLGMVAWLNEAGTRMESTRHGAILCIGSRADARGLGSMPVYGATKAFQNSYMESIRNRLVRHGVTVSTVKPGPVDTEMTAHLKISKLSSRVAAEKCLAKAGSNGNHYLKFSDRIAAGIIRRFPSFVLRKLKL